MKVVVAQGIVGLLIFMIADVWMVRNDINEAKYVEVS